MPNVIKEEVFDLRTHSTDLATGRTVPVNCYTLYFIKNRRYFERPIGSGNIWFENNKPAGRIAFKADGEAVVNEAAPHVAYVPPPSGAEKIAAERDAALAELAAIKAERDARLTPPDAPAAQATKHKKD